MRVLNRIYALYPEQRAQGEVMLNGRNLLDAEVDLALLRMRIGMVFQKPTPFPMSVFDNVAFALQFARPLSASELRVRVESALRDAALWDEVKDDLGEDARALSGGTAAASLHRAHRGDRARSHSL